MENPFLLIGAVSYLIDNLNELLESDPPPERKLRQRYLAIAREMNPLLATMQAMEKRPTVDLQTHAS